MKKLLIINRKQFGYHIPTYKYAQHLDGLKISYLCFDTGEKRISEPGVKVSYVKRTGNKLVDGWNFLKTANRKILQYSSEDVIFVVNFEFCFFVTLFNKTPDYILNIVTLAVLGGPYKRRILDILTKINSYFFDKIAVISRGVGEKLGLNDFKELPLGADVISEKDKDFNTPLPFYIGTLNNRNISQAVIGYCKFIKDNQHLKESSRFHIVGSGKKEEIETLRKTIDKNDTFSNIHYHGYKNHEEVKHLFDTCNLGLSFIPQEEYFEHQPPTKTFEYLLSGLVCIGTKTSLHYSILNDKNGILCEDSPQGIYNALQTFVSCHNKYESGEIRQQAKQYKWSNIIHNFLRNELIETSK